MCHQFFISSNVSRRFWGRPISAGVWGGDRGGKVVYATLWVQGKVWWGISGKAPRSSMNLVLWNHFSLTYTFHNLWWKVNLNSKFEIGVNFSVQSHASLTREDPASLQITYHHVYYLKYTKLKSFIGHWVWAAKPVYWLLNPSGYVCDFIFLLSAFLSRYKCIVQVLNLQRFNVRVLY